MHREFALSLSFLASLAGASVALAQPAQRTLFVTNNVGSPGSVSSLRVNEDGTLILVGTYNNFGPNPQDCAVTADGSRLIVLNATDVITNEPVYTATINSNSTISVNPVPTTVPDNALSFSVGANDVLLIPSASSDRLFSLRVLSNSTTILDDEFGGDFPTKPIITPNGAFAYVIGSGILNDVCAYTIAANGALTNLECEDILLGGGFGAAIHPSGNTLYVSTGLLNTIARFDINQASGLLTASGSYLSGNVGNNSAVEMAMHPAGTYLYVCHVVSDTLSVLRINADRSLSTMNLTYSLGSDIRDVITDGKFVFVTDESNAGGAAGINVFKINANGSLTQVGTSVATGGSRPQFMAIWPQVAPPPPPCLGDANSDFEVNFDDVLETLGAWGGAGPLGDANHDGAVNFPDVIAELSHWGVCP